MLSAAQWLQVSPYLDEALALPQDQRGVWVESLRRTNAGVADLLARLLEKHGVLSEEKFLESAQIPLPGGCFAGQKIGAYTLVSHLGQGGMGSVWLAERSDGRFERRVAIKFLSIGFSGNAGGRRFRREGKILGRLAHPHIAEMADAGVSPEGQPYLVLEHVEGEYIDRYCDRRALDVRSRVTLFLDVLAAVAHAHNQLIVHGDIKPSNVLVRTDGQVKLLDFGISRLLEEEFETSEAGSRKSECGPGATLPYLTRLTGAALTPSYAAPEQIQGQPINTASDVYSLGVLLFELLTGERPYRGTIDSRDALETALLAGEVQRPSAAVQEVEKASARSTTVKKLTALLKGDLDAIVLKALSTRPDERYSNADAFAQDIQRYLGRRPVLARPASMWYRSKKFTRRNRLKVTALAAFIVALAAGVFAVSWQARKVRREAATVESVLQFMENIFRLNSGSQADPVKARQTTVRELLDISVTRLDRELPNEPAAKLRLLNTLYDLYGDLDLWDRELDLDRRRLKAARLVYGPSDPAVARVLLDLAGDSVNQDFLSEEADAVREARKILDARHDYTSELRANLECSEADVLLNADLRQALAHTEAGVRLIRAFPQSLTQANLLQSSVYYELALGRYDTAKAVSLKAISVERSVPAANALLPWTNKHLAEAQDGLEELTASDQTFREARDLARKYFGGHGVMSPIIDFAYAGFLASSSRLGEAIAIAEPARDRALELSRQGIATSYLPLGIVKYGRALIDYGHVEKGLEVLNSAEAMREHFPPALKIFNIELFEERAAGLIEIGRYAEAMALLTEAARERRGLNQAHTPWYNRNLLIQARLLGMTGRTDEALQILADYQVFSPDKGPVSRSKLDELLTRSEIYLAKDDFNAARSLAAEAREEITGSPNRSYLASWEARADLIEGKATLVRGDAPGALPLLRRAVAIRTTLLDKTSPALADAEIALSNCYLDLRDFRQASELLARAKGIHGRHPALGKHYREPLLRLERRQFS